MLAHGFMRATTAVLLFATLCLLTACFRYPPAVPVSFPDDPRVLHGEWVMDVTLADWQAGSHLFVPDHRLLLAWTHEGNTVRGWQQPDADTGWMETPAEAFKGLNPASYDAEVGAFITFRVSNGKGTADTVSVPDGARQRVEIVLPAGVTVLGEATGSGSLFVHGVSASEGTRLYWWDAATGAPGGSVAIQGAPDGMERSTNGRILSFWNLRGGAVQVVDTAAPAAPQRIGLAICRTTGLAEASPDGRWFALRECSNRISLVDLHAPNPVRTSTGIAAEEPVRFAADSSELLFTAAGGSIRSLDAHSGEVRTVFTLPESDGQHWLHGRQVSLHREAGILTVLSDEGTVLMVATDSRVVSAQLPVPERGTVQLQLVASNLQNDGYTSGYDWSGTALWPAALGRERELAASGSVLGSGLHEYRADLGAQAAPPPHVYIHGDLTDDEVAYGLAITEQNASATEYEGTLWLDGGEEAVPYSVVLRRP